MSLNLNQTRKLLTNLSEELDSAVDDVILYATKTQDEVYNILLRQINLFEINNGSLVADQDYTTRIATIQRLINSKIESIYYPSVRRFLRTYTTIDDTNISLHKGYNELLIEKSMFDSARRSIYDQAEYYLTNALADAYVQPAKFLLMQAASQGLSIKQAESLIRNWNTGQLPTGKLSTSRPTPRLQAYAGQIASDSIFQYNGNIQDKIATTYNLKFGIYVGDIIKDSRPACKYLVGLRRKINIDEIPEVLIKYPDGVIPGTTKENFPVYRCGYRCRHLWMPVKG